MRIRQNKPGGFADCDVRVFNQGAFCGGIGTSIRRRKETKSKCSNRRRGGKQFQVDFYYAHEAANHFGKSWPDRDRSRIWLHGDVCDERKRGVVRVWAVRGTVDW